MTTQTEDTDIPPRVPIPEDHQGKAVIRYGRSFALGYLVGDGDAARYVVTPASRWLRGPSRTFAATPEGWREAWTDFERREPGAAADYRRKLNPPAPRHFGGGTGWSRPKHDPTAALAASYVGIGLGLLALVAGFLTGLLHLDGGFPGESCYAWGDHGNCQAAGAADVLWAISISLVTVGFLALLAGCIGVAMASNTSRDDDQV